MTLPKRRADVHAALSSKPAFLSLIEIKTLPLPILIPVLLYYSLPILRYITNTFCYLFFCYRRELNSIRLKDDDHDDDDNDDDNANDDNDDDGDDNDDDDEDCLMLHFHCTL